ncbi:MAG TPA: class IV adenylate cyclase [Thermoanaerobaculia bacterium]|nr:class IV adenylate cyclase [Thermoanaerobaculia bacterium]
MSESSVAPPVPVFERELKFADAALDRLRDRLAELEAERVGQGTFEENWVFDRERELETSGRLLRLRKDGHGAWLTYKGPLRFEGRVRLRVENEVLVDNLDAARMMLEGLGYSVVRRYQKMREMWRLGGVIIALDHTPIGDFAEFEGDAAERVAKRFGFDPERAERRSYLRLYADYLEEHPEAPADMVFPDRA